MMPKYCEECKKLFLINHTTCDLCGGQLKETKDRNSFNRLLRLGYRFDKRGGKVEE
jgi:hypothetical protein